MSRVGLVTGATQGLGLALVATLAERWGEDDVVYLTGRDRGRLDEAAAMLPAGSALVRTEHLDVGCVESVETVASSLAERHGSLDVVISNAYRRVLPEHDMRSIIADYVNVNNLGMTRVLRSFGPLIADGGCLIVVASTLGTLHYLAPVLHERFDELRTLDEVDEAVGRWRDAVAAGPASAEAWPAFINIPSKIGQVSAVRALAHQRRDADLPRGILLAAVCPGMIDTGASRPWFDVSRAQTPMQAAGPVVDLALSSQRAEGHYGELVRFGSPLPWKP
jgi:NAD(P)-dependent dehydrogenase (short-subunit alcohol dehydrogenase family)